MLSAGAMLFSNAAAYSNSPSQLVILGMHHSGTSLLANLTMMMGAFGGDTNELLHHPVGQAYLVLLCFFTVCRCLPCRRVHYRRDSACYWSQRLGDD